MKWNNWSYKKKNRLLAAVVLLLIVLVYSFSLSKTVEVYGKVHELEMQADSAANAPMKAVALEKRLNEIDSHTGSGQAGDIRQVLLGIITGYCKEKGTVLREFPQTVQQEEKDIVIETNVFTVEGNFSQLLKLVYYLEQVSRTGRVSSVKFNAKKDAVTKTLALNATIYIQNTRKKDMTNEK